MIRTIVLLLLAGCASAAETARQPVCGPRAEVLDALEKQYGERPQSIGLTDGGIVIEVTTSPVGGWSLLATGPDGTTCLMLAGEGWQEVRKGAGI